MERIIDFKTTCNDNEKTVEAFLKEHGFTHQVLVNLKKTNNGITRNGVWAYTNEKISAGDKISVHIVENCNSDNILPIKIPLDIAYEDDDLIVINKPAGMPAHPSMGNHDNSLANALMYYFNSQGLSFVFRCINRLDRDTTGLTIVAKHALASGILGKAVARRDIHRTYYAVCSGHTPDCGRIDAPIARKSDSAIERCVDFDKGEYAITDYTRLKYNPDKNLSLVQLKLLTGRTHQIRVHMKYIGFPLIGDFLYNPDYTYMDRQALHSGRLEFIHPVTGKKMDLISDIPSDMKSLFKLV
ncbi:MAG: RluA family pseudouridine synthase [Agathobacter sp.]|uniref:RluA family pseudouridine synthase n=1 Tax=Agathobacter sp. TaxID=2021311 RepID=UPI002E7A59EA|nr:RluA family pseudouridine synthase [Agathobacter sp.]MEE1218236.1 RluA family pseudouridine synthase [Agathobacter sp.]